MMKYRSTHPETNIWYNYFNHPPKKRDKQLAGTESRKQVSPGMETTAGCLNALQGDAVVFETGILEMFRDMRRQERHHLDLLSSAGRLPGPPEFEAIFAQSIVAVRHHLSELDHILKLMDPAVEPRD